jgi:hypothetical protein
MISLIHGFGELITSTNVLRDSTYSATMGALGTQIKQIRA